MFRATNSGNHINSASLFYFYHRTRGIPAAVSGEGILHMVDSVNSSVPLGPSPENAVSREDILSHMGMQLFVQLRMELNLKDRFMEEHKQPGFLGRLLHP
jgi:hypothetical protein